MKILFPASSANFSITTKLNIRRKSSHDFFVAAFLRRKGGKKHLTKPARELDAQEKRTIRNLVTRKCANHDNDYGCLPLDCKCPMLGICYTNSAMCRYFREAVLPNDPELEAGLNMLATKTCKRCGKRFPIAGRRAYCSDQCAEAAQKEHTADRVRKFRNKAVM